MNIAIAIQELRRRIKLWRRKNVKLPARTPGIQRTTLTQPGEYVLKHEPGMVYGFIARDQGITTSVTFYDVLEESVGHIVAKASPREGKWHGGELRVRDGAKALLAVVKGKGDFAIDVFHS